MRRNLSASQSVLMFSQACIGLMQEHNIRWEDIEKIESLRGTHHRNVAAAVKLPRKPQAYLKLFAAASYDQRTHEVNEAASHSLLNLRRQVFPLGIQDEIL